MSLILDALKKSEAERQRGQTPNLLSPLPSTPRQAQTNTKSGLPWMIVIVLAVAISAIGFFQIKEKMDGASAHAPGVATEVTQSITTEAPEKPEAAATAAPTPAPAPVEKPDAATTIAAAPVVASRPALPTQTEAPQAVAEPEPVERIAGLSEMSAEQRQQLPTLKLSMHVYSSETSKRFAIIDGQRVNEGSVLGNAVVEQIRQDGVVLSVQGQSYLLPRP